MNKRIIPLAKRQNFNLAPGHYTAVVESMYYVKSTGTCANMFKILFAPIGQTKKLEQSVVAVEYCTDAPDEQITETLDTILGGELEAHLDDCGDFNHEIVKGRLVDIRVDSYQGQNHKLPFTFVTGIYPPGTLGLN
jgi:hypothetical protein